MIPVLGVAIYNRPDLLERCLQSIDYPIGQMLVVNNGRTDLSELHKKWDFLEWERGNLGVAGAWNWIQDMAFNPLDAEACLICGNDVTWTSGDLRTLWQTHLDFPEADFVFGNHSYSNFMVLRSGWEKVGAFDENFYPAYLEDSSHWQTIRMTGAKAIHAAGLNAKHEGSATINADPALKAIISCAQEKGWDYYSRRYGCRKWSHAAETFATPFNDPDWPPNKWILSEERLAQPHVFSQWPPE